MGTINEKSVEHISILSNAEIPFIGGRVFDSLLVRNITQTFYMKTGIDLWESPKSIAKVMKQAN